MHRRLGPPAGALGLPPAEEAAGEGGGEGGGGEGEGGGGEGEGGGGDGGGGEGEGGLGGGPGGGGAVGGLGGALGGGGEKGVSPWMQQQWKAKVVAALVVSSTATPLSPQGTRL